MGRGDDVCTLEPGRVAVGEARRGHDAAACIRVVPGPAHVGAAVEHGAVAPAHQRVRREAPGQGKGAFKYDITP